MLENKNMTKGIIQAVSISKTKGTKKQNVSQVFLKKGFGIAGDAHAGFGLRQVSLLAEESIEKMRLKGLKVAAGDFAENITTKSINLLDLKIGTAIKAGSGAVLEITQIGKICHAKCEISQKVGDCLMPKEGIFAKVIKGGIVKPLDSLEVIER